MKDITAGTITQSTLPPNSAASKHFFKREEFNCRCGCGLNNVSAELIATLDRIRELADIPLRITSGSRCKKHNAAIGGNADSAHIKGFAADIAIDGGHERYLVVKSAITAGVERLGIGSGLIHLDIDKNKPAQAIWLYA
ncbi:MAG: peptidase M15 [Nitrospirae bacterium]|nr:peptidase M15 [Nitrospirota bacterium]